MVLLTRSICRLARPAFTSASFTTAARPAPRVLSRGAQALRRNNLGCIRTLTGKREKVKVLLVLYDGKQHAEEVSSLQSPPQLMLNAHGSFLSAGPRTPRYN
jgi:formate dehydrogenase